MLNSYMHSNQVNLKGIISKALTHAKRSGSEVPDNLDGFFED